MVYFVALLVILIIIVELCKTEVIYSESFWWSTSDGLRFSVAALYRLKYLNYYYIDFDIRYKHPKEHPNYKEFLETVKKKKDEVKNIRN
jgi:hypothetical protein